MIHRNNDEIRVERDQWRVWIPVGIGEALILFLAIYFATGPPIPLLYAGSSGLVILGVLIAIYYHRRRDLLVITPDEIAYSYGGRMFRVPRSDVAYVRLVPIVLFLAVVLHDSAGEARHKLLFNDLIPKDLREAFDEAGIPVR